jgi:tetratricopeptide (TPR) repeat protein
VRKTDAGTWSRFGETAVLALAFLAPLAAHGFTYDPSALRTALLESGALTLALAWLLKGLDRGRWEAAAGVGTVLGPLVALAGWTAVHFALSPFKAAALPALTLEVSAWLVFAFALLELGGARYAARLSFWTAAAATLVGAVGVFQKLSGGTAIAATLGSPERAAAFAAAALPVVLALRLDPEATAVRRALATASAVLLALLAGWSGSGRGAAAFVLSAAVFALVCAAILRSPQARRAAAVALGMAALAAVCAAASGARFDGATPFAGGFGSLLLAWTVLAAAATGLRAAWLLRAQGATAEAGFSAAFSAAFAASAAAAALGWLPADGAGLFLAWAAGGVAAGLSPLSRSRALVRTLPIPAGHDVRRLMQGPVFLMFAAVVVWPGLWLSSDVRFNRAVAEARAGHPEAALADAGRVWPGSAVYAPSLYLRGRAAADLGRPQEALDFYARLDSVSPDFSRVHARRAEAYAALGDLGSAARERARQAELTPTSVSELVAWCEAARAVGDLDGARRAAAAAAALNPYDSSVRTALAENSLLEKRLAEKDGARKRDGRKGLAFKPKTR